MDFTVEATVHLDGFQDKASVRTLLRSHDFAVSDWGRDRLRVKGSFLKLKAVKARLEQLLHSQNQTHVAPRPSSPLHAVSSEATCKYDTSGPLPGGKRGGLEARHQPQSTSPPSSSTSASQVPNTSHSHATSSGYRASSSPGSFLVGVDIYRYAESLRKKDLDAIRQSHGVQIVVRETGDSCSISLQGKSARRAARELQSLLDELSKTLRTQDVHRTDVSREGRGLLESIQKNNNIYKSVLVCRLTDRLHLIGPSGESYELQQKLLGICPIVRAGRRR